MEKGPPWADQTLLALDQPWPSPTKETDDESNQKFAKKKEAEMGRPRPAKKEKEKAPISSVWLYVLLFVVFGGLIFELLRLIYFSSYQ